MEVRLHAAAAPRTRPARNTHATPDFRTRARVIRTCTMHGPATTTHAARSCSAQHPLCDRTQQHTAHTTQHTAPIVPSAGQPPPDLEHRCRVRIIARRHRRTEATAHRKHQQQCKVALAGPTALAAAAHTPPAGHRRPAGTPYPSSRACSTPQHPPERAHAARGRRGQPRPEEAASARGNGV